MLKLLPRSNLESDCWHSMLISLLRGVAALTVVLSHLRALFYPAFELIEQPPVAFIGLAFITGFAHLSVVVFFILSGWLVGGGFLNKIEGERAYSNYAIDRVTRLWIVLIPVFGVSLLCGMLLDTIDTGAADLGVNSEFSFGVFAGNLVGLQEMYVACFGGNFALWSLANEIWYYVMFPFLLLMLRGQRLASRVLSALVLVAIAKLLTGAVLAYFLIWLMGVLFSRIRLELGTAVRRLLLLTVLGIAVYFRLRGHLNTQSLDSFAQDFLFTLAFVLWLSSMQFKAPRSSTAYRLLDRFGQFFASFSFTLYVLHVPLILLFIRYVPPMLEVAQFDAHNPVHSIAYAAMLAAIVLASYLFHLPFEANTQRVRNWIKRLILPRPVRVPA